MATRRTYRPKKYKSGGAVTPEANTDELSLSAPQADSPETLETPPPVETVADGGAISAPKEVDDAVARALAATINAEKLQRQARTPMSVEEHIERLPVSEFKKSFLRQNPMMLHPEIVPIAARAYQRARSAGIADDSEQLNAAMLDGVRQEIEGRQKRMVQSAQDAVTAMPPMPEPEPAEIEKAVDLLDRQSDAIRNVMSAEDAVSTEVPPIAAPPTRRSLPISAPVSRDIPTEGGRRMSEQRTVHLSAEERALSHSSYSWLTKREAEMEYAKQKLRLAEMRRRGEYPERERN
jgi:hypothetical protein